MATIAVLIGGNNPVMRWKESNCKLLLHPLPRPIQSKPILFCTSMSSCRGPLRSDVDSKSGHSSQFQWGMNNHLLMIKDNWPLPAENPNVAVNKLWGKYLQAFMKSAVASLLLFGLVFMYKSNSVLAAPVNRVGGSWSPNRTISVGRIGSPPIETTSSEEYYDPILTFALFVFMCPYIFGLFFFVFFSMNFDLSKYEGIALIISWTLLMCYWVRSQAHSSVIKLHLQVRLSDTGTLQTDLNRIAETANTCTDKGLRYILKDTLVALLRQPDHCISGHSSEIIPKFTRGAAQHCFYELVVKERLKYETESIVNVDDMEIKTNSQTTSGNDHQLRNYDYIVVTILVASEGKYELPTISDVSDLKMVLEKFASMNPSLQILGVEVLWTLQEWGSNQASP